MIKTVIVEDEKNSRELLQRILQENFPDIAIAGTADNIDDAFRLIMETVPQLVFMDIEMKKATAFDLLNKFSSVSFEIIFTTAYEKYALKAIKFSALDYLLKPIALAELKVAVDKARNQVKNRSSNQNLEMLLQNMRSIGQDNHQLALPTRDGLIFVKVRDIIFCESEGAYTQFHFRNSPGIMTSKNLKEYEELLSDYDFFRIHHSYLVNLREIIRYIRGDGGQVMMSNNRTLDVSKRRKEAFLLKLGNR
ncbi:MAG TPA: LytTR family DNA-binding domain-containing protein [Chitinophagales bacterium]|nr:LytTR family DNA-binding domain-containing protein [Chitinophagales bacterium]